VRTTRASAAVDRLKARTGESGYSLIHQGDGNLALSLDGKRIGEALELDSFVAFVNSLHKGPPKRVSKFEREFDEKLANSRAERQGDSKEK
jgi:hypothetical protein